MKTISEIQKKDNRRPISGLPVCARRRNLHKAIVAECSEQSKAHGVRVPTLTVVQVR
jgi:hypothetical protein